MERIFNNYAKEPGVFSNYDFNDFVREGLSSGYDDIFSLFNFCILGNHTKKNAIIFGNIEWIYNANLITGLYSHDQERFKGIIKHLKIRRIINLLKDYIDNVPCMRESNAIEILIILRTFNDHTRKISLIEEGKYDDL